MRQVNLDEAEELHAEADVDGDGQVTLEELRHVRSGKDGATNQ